MLNLLLLHGSEYNRGTGCGKTAHPGLCGVFQVTGIPTANCLESFNGRFKTENRSLFREAGSLEELSEIVNDRMKYY